LADHNKNTRKRNELFVEGNADEIQDGDYIKTSLGNGFLQVMVSLLRVME